MLGVELTFGRGEQPVDDLAVLGLGRRFGQTAQPTVGVEIGDAGALDEDLLDVSAREQLTQRTELGDRTQHASRHLRRVAERHLVAEPGAALVVVDRALDLDAHLADLGRRLQAPALDAGDRVAADDVVRVGPNRHDAARTASRVGDRARASRRPARASSATARVNAPRATGVPFHAASPTRRSAGTNTTSTNGRLVRDLLVELAPPEPRVGRAIHDDQQRRVGRERERLDRPRRASRATPCGEGSHTATTTSDFADERARRREPSARRARRDVLEHARAVGDDDVGVVGEPVDDPHDLARPHLRPRVRVRQPGDDRKPRRRFDDDAPLELAAAVLDRVDRGAEVRLDRQVQPSRDRRRNVVGVDEHARRSRRPSASASSIAISVRPTPGGPPTVTSRPSAWRGDDRTRSGSRSSRRPATLTIARTNASGPASDSTSASTPSASRCSRLAVSSRSCTPTTARPCACTSATSARVSAGQR